MLLSNIGHRINTVSYIPKEFFDKYYSIAFAILPGIAGGLALKLIPQKDGSGIQAKTSDIWCELKVFNPHRFEARKF